ncbi:MAG: zf-TFIIB domain-containing protein [Deltaproteobacteria bacterium]
MKCPKCNSSLKTAEIENISVEICPSCDGLWLDKIELAKIVDFDFNLLKKSEIASTLDKDKQIDVTENKIIKCPNCSSQMISTNSLFNADTNIDICPACNGTWLDDGELKEVINYMKKNSGSLSDEQINKIKLKLQHSQEALHKSGIIGLMESYFISIKKLVHHKDYDAF